MINVHILVGNIASGKSTYSKEMAQNGWLVLNNDSIVQSIHANSYLSYDLSLKETYHSIQRFFILQFIKQKRNIVIDSACHTRKKRQRYIDWVASAYQSESLRQDLPKQWLQPEIHATRRFNSDNRGYTYGKWLEVANRFNSEYEEVSKTEKFNELIFNY